MMAEPRNNKTTDLQEIRIFNIKDIVIILGFLGGLTGIYTSVSERLVKLETKGDNMTATLKEIKEDTARMVSKLEESNKNLQIQLRDLENAVLYTRKK